MTAVAPNAALSGKRLTVILMVVLLGTGALFYWVTTAYSTYNAARRQTDRDWRELATLLETRYQLVEQRLTEADSQQVDASLKQEWRAARDTYTGTGISGLQIDAATKVEAVIGRLPQSLVADQSPSDELTGALEKYEKSAATQRAIGQTAGSRLLKIMLNLPDPKSFVLQSSVR